MTDVARAARALKELSHLRLEGLRFRLVDAKGEVVGRLASQIAVLLQGKDKPTFNPKKDCGDVVIVINAAHVHLSYDKWDTKLYRWHTGYPGGLRARTAREQWEQQPTALLRHAVSGMLPVNKTRLVRMDKLKVFPEADHPFTDFPLMPFVPRSSRPSDQGLGWQLPQGFSPLNPERYSFRVLTSPRLQGRPRPVLDMSDLLTEDERRGLGIAAPEPKQSQKQQQQQ